MAKDELNKKITAEISAGFLKMLIEKLADEEKPFDLKVRRIKRGVWEIDLYTNGESEDYFTDLINNPERWRK